jgi:hypothetical protein
MPFLRPQRAIMSWHSLLFVWFRTHVPVTQDGASSSSPAPANSPTRTPSMPINGAKGVNPYILD